MQLTSKFQKLRHLHIYLWLLSNGCSEEEWCQLSSILPPVQYPWVGHMVGPATPPSSGRVSITYKEVLDQLPLCAILMLFGVQKVLGLRLGRCCACCELPLPLPSPPARTVCKEATIGEELL